MYIISASNGSAWVYLTVGLSWSTDRSTAKQFASVSAAVTVANGYPCTTGIERF